MPPFLSLSLLSFLSYLYLSVFRNLHVLALCWHCVGFLCVEQDPDYRRLIYKWSRDMSHEQLDHCFRNIPHYDRFVPCEAAGYGTAYAPTAHPRARTLTHAHTCTLHAAFQMACFETLHLAISLPCLPHMFADTC